MRKLILFDGKKKEQQIFLNHMRFDKETETDCYFKEVPLILRILRRIHIGISCFGIGIWFLDWKKSLEEYDMIICIASKRSPQILRWIKSKQSDIRCINYYWDNIKVSKYPVRVTDIFENWSFCKSDCEKYSMKYNPQFYINSIILPQKEMLYHVCYVGADREGTLRYRNDLAEYAYQLFKKNCISVFFWYVTECTRVSESIRRDKRISEREYYEVVAQSKAVLDLVEPDEEWITLRPLLALSNRKKLITNCTLILDEKYYSPENVFILGKDDESKLRDFIESDFKEIDEKVLRYYEVEAWLKRFVSREDSDAN